jgi:hypothetical protein
MGQEPHVLYAGKLLHMRPLRSPSSASRIHPAPSGLVKMGGDEVACLTGHTYVHGICARMCVLWVDSDTDYFNKMSSICAYMLLYLAKNPIRLEYSSSNIPRLPYVIIWGSIFIVAVGLKVLSVVF